MTVIPFKRARKVVQHDIHPGPDMTIRKPSLFWTLTEPARFLMETSAMAALSPLLMTAPRGNGQPVLVLPGFATSDRMTMLMRQYLSLMGFKVFPWELGWNFDQHSAGENGEHVAARINAIADETGQSVSLVGWSLGGIIAREVARRDPSRVRQVITLGSPFTGNPHANAISKVYEMMTGNEVASPAIRMRFVLGHHPLKIPSTAIYSRMDGIAAWRNCMAETNEISENVEIQSSHFGFVTSPAVYYALADRLAQPEGEWKPFVRQGPFAHFYP